MGKAVLNYIEGIKKRIADKYAQCYDTSVIADAYHNEMDGLIKVAEQEYVEQQKVMVNANPVDRIEELERFIESLQLDVSDDIKRCELMGRDW